MQESSKIFTNKAKSEEGWLVNVIIRFLQYQKDRVNRKEITGSTLRNYVKVLKLFCEMNDLLVPWKKLTRGLPKARNTQTIGFQEWMSSKKLWLILTGE